MKLQKVIIFCLALGVAVSANAARTSKNARNGKQAQVATTVAAHSININKASAKSLQAVKGIGPQKAQAIITYRDKNGDFKNVNDILKVKGIGEKWLGKVGKYLTV
jgi:competence protein ComEA